MVPGEQHTQQPAQIEQQQSQQPAMVEPAPEPQASVKNVEPDPAPVKKVKTTTKKAATKKQEVAEIVDNGEKVEQADYAGDTTSTGAEPLVLVPPGQPVASNGESLDQAPPPVQQQAEQAPEQKSRSFFNFGKSSGGSQKLTGKAAERAAGLEASDTVINTNYANARQAKAASDDTGAGEQVASLAPEPGPEAQIIPEPEQQQPQQSAPETTEQPQQAATGYVAQLASFRSEAEALAEYDRLRSRHADLLNGLSPRVTKAVVSGSSRYRLGVGPLASRGAASKLCSNLIASGERDCLVRSN
jgi:hypothetical protein